MSDASEIAHTVEHPHLRAPTVLDSTGPAIECRVVAHKYGEHRRGELVKVPMAEVRRANTKADDGTVIFDALLPLDQEEQQRIDAEKERNTTAEMQAEKAARAGWERLEATRRRVLGVEHQTLADFARAAEQELSELADVADQVADVQRELVAAQERVEQVGERHADAMVAAEAADERARSARAEARRAIVAGEADAKRGAKLHRVAVASEQDAEAAARVVRDLDELAARAQEEIPVLEDKLERLAGVAARRRFLEARVALAAKVASDPRLAAARAFLQEIEADIAGAEQAGVSREPAGAFRSAVMRELFGGST